MLYIPIRKIEEQQRLIYGIAAAEEIDRANEILDYASSKPYIQEWSLEQVELSNGVNYGNVRAMHQELSAGMIIKPIDYNDIGKKINVVVKVVDDAEWLKVLAGVYTGLSFGGNYINRWTDKETGAMRYTLKPCELSLADRPCVPSAGIINVIKSDGSVQKLLLKGRCNMAETKEEKVKKMDINEFGSMINEVNDGLASDENAPQPLKEAVANLAKVLQDCTETNPAGTEPEGKDPEEQPEEIKGCAPKDVAKIVEDAMNRMIEPMQQKMAELAEKIDQARTLQDRLEKIEQAAAPSRIVLKTDGLKLKQDAAETSDETALDKIKQSHTGQNSWAY